MKSEKLTTGKVYTDYDQMIRRVEQWMDTKNPHIAGCEGPQVKARLIQRIVEMTNEDYSQWAINDVDKYLQQLKSSPKFIVVGGLRICTNTWGVSISLRQWIRQIVLFIAVWLHLLIFLVIALFKKSPWHSSAATLLMEAGGGYEECDSRFVRFCRQGPIRPLSSAKYVIVKSKKRPLNSTDPSFFYTPHPFIYLTNNLLQRSVRFSLLFRHLMAPFYYLQALIAYPITVLLGRDMSVVFVAQLLDKKNLIEAIIVTTSSFPSQPLWMKGLTNQKFKLHMVWYSQNFIPKMYIGEEERSDLPPARHMRVDVHWVWTDGFGTYLRELGQTSEIRVVGPILWYLPEQITGLGDAHIKIALFDITPLPDGKTVFGATKNYYSVTTIKTFVTDILKLGDDIAAASGKEVLIFLKHKRAQKSGRDSTYFEFLEQLIKIKPNFKLIDHQTNLFGLLEECDLSISVPYTSTAYVAASVNKPAIYYDPFGELIPRYEKNEFVYFASGPKELGQLTGKLLNITPQPTANV